MANKEFFPQRPESHPMVYAYTDSDPLYKGLLKVGYTEKDVEKRVAQHIVPAESAMRSDGAHQLLRKRRVYEAGDE